MTTMNVMAVDPRICLSTVIIALIAGAGGMEGAGEVRVFGMQLDLWAKPSSDVVVRYNLTQKFPEGTESELEEFSVCYWARPTTLTSYETHFSLAISDQENDVLHLYRRGGALGFYYNGVRQRGFPNLTSPINLQKWNHYCHMFRRGEYIVYFGGEELARGTIASGKVPMSMRGVMTLGQEQDQLSGGYELDQCYRGYMAQLNIYSRILTKEEVLEQATCQEVIHGDIFSSDREEMEVFGASSETVNASNLCEASLEYVIFPQAKFLDQSMLMCHRVGYEIYSPSTRGDNNLLYNISLRFAAKCKSNYHLWIGATDELEEGVWRKFINNDIVTDPPFELMEPNGGTGENCILMFLPNGRWVDTSCSIEWNACVPCQVDRKTPLRLRGLCFSVEAETFFEVLGYKEDTPYFHGYYGYMVYKNALGHWEMYDTTEGQTIAVLALSSEDSYPLGRHHWTLNASLCDNPRNSKMELSLSVCDNYEFSCSNGDCIPKEHRCNGNNDCTDFSDEDGCEMIVLPQGYRANQPPENNTGEGPINLSASVRILRIVEISDVRRAINVEMDVELRWQDPRITYLNLGDSLEWNKLTKKETSRIWTPRITFPNVYDGNINNIAEEVAIRKFGFPLPPHFNDVRMDMAYSGESALLVQHIHYSGSFACSFDVFYYPFDVQRCFISLQLASVRKELTTFTDERTRVFYLEERLLPGYMVTECNISVTETGNNETRYSVLRVEFEMSRRWTVIVLSVFVPTTMLICIGYATLFIKLTLLDVRMAVSLTTLLVLYTLFSNTSSSLPVTAYVKMIDVWFFHCIFLLFFITLTHVLAEHLENIERVVTVQPALRRKKVLRESAKKVVITVRLLVVPVALLIFNFVYWTLLLRSRF